MALIWTGLSMSASAEGTDYDTVKHVLANMFEAGVFWTDNDRYDPRKIGLRLHPCASTHYGISPALEFDAGNGESLYANLAVAVLLAERGVEATDYPGDLWRHYLEAYEARILATGPAALDDYGWLQVTRDNAEYEAILRDLAAYRASNGGNLPPVVMGDGCYNGGIEARLKTDPPGGRIWLLTEYDYRLCKAQGIDPLDLNRCRWREESGRIVSVVSGNYRVYARWEDGRETRSRQSFLEVLGDDNSVTIRP